MPSTVRVLKKNINLQVRFLEGLSPEYVQLLAKNKGSGDSVVGEEGEEDAVGESSSTADMETSLVKINTRIQELQKNLKSKTAKQEA